MLPELGLALQLNTSLTTLRLGEFRVTRKIGLVRFVSSTAHSVTAHSRTDQPLCCAAEVERRSCGFTHDPALAKSSVS